MFQLHLTFCGRSEADFAQLNAMLAGLHLSGLEIEDHRGYLCVTRDTASCRTSRRYGLDHIRLNCTEATAEEDFVYQLEAHLEDLCPSFDFEQAVQRWRQHHPDRIVRVMVGMRFGDTAVLLLAHHRRRP